MADKLEKSKVPQLHKKVLARKQIDEILDAASMDEAVCMVAPYGYGKTTAALSWLRERNRRAAWITLDETDNNEASFVESLIAAIMPFDEQSDVDFCNRQYAGDTQAFLLDIGSRLVEGNISVDTLVIDNFHLISDVGLLCDVKDFFYSLLGHLRIIIISRNELSPFFNELILKKHICLITIKELNFSIDEMEEYFNMHGHLVPRKNLISIHDETEGWPAAIDVILTVSREEPIEYGEEARAHVKDFLETEVWNGLDEGVKDFLLRTSVLNKLTPNTCLALTGTGRTLPILKWLFDNGLFISELEKDIYFYHRVFKDFLLDKLSISGIDEHVLYKKAGWWHMEKNEYEQAFPYLIKAGDLGGVSQALKKFNPAYMGLEQYDEMVSSITTLDIEDLRDYPYVAARLGLFHLTFGNLDEMQRIYDILLDWNESGELNMSQQDYPEYMWEVGLLGYLNPNESVFNNKRHNDWFNFSQDFPLQREQQHFRSAAVRNRSVLSGLRDYCPTLPYIDLVDHANTVTKGNYIKNNSSLLQIEIIQAEYAYELEDFTKAEKIIRNVMAVTEKSNHIDLYFICIVVLSKITRAVRGLGEIEQLETHMKEMIEMSDCDFMWPRFYEFQQRNRLAEGFRGQTAEFLAETKGYIGKPYIFTLTRYITLAHTFISTNDYQEALMLLWNLEEICHKYKRTRDLIEVHILQAVAEYGLERGVSACRHLVKAIELAREYGFIRVFSDEAKDIWPILELVRKQMNDDYVKKIIISCKKNLVRFGDNGITGSTY